MLEDQKRALPTYEEALRRTDLPLGEIIENAVAKGASADWVRGLVRQFARQCVERAHRAIEAESSRRLH